MERMKAHGAESLSNAELLAILIRTGNQNKGALDLARDLLALSGNSLTRLSSMSLEAICKMPGIGPGKAMNIICALEIGRRFIEEGIDDKAQFLNSASDTFMMMLPRMKGLAHEEFWVIFLNPLKKVLGMERLTTGGHNSTVIDQKVIVKRALEQNASGIVIVHNHPSGNPLPSQADISETSLLHDNCKVFDIAIVDHIIMGADSFFSFADNGVTKAKKGGRK